MSSVPNKINLQQKQYSIQNYIKTKKIIHLNKKIEDGHPLLFTLK